VREENINHQIQINYHIKNIKKKNYRSLTFMGGGYFLFLFSCRFYFE